MEKTMGARLFDLRIESEKGKNGKPPSTKEVSRESGVAEGTINGLELDSNSNPQSKSLVALADYYGVSCDYLLGRTDIEKLDEVAQHVNAKYGLSESSLEALEEIVNPQDWLTPTRPGIIPEYRDTINALLSSAEFRDLIDHMVEAKVCHEHTLQQPSLTERQYPIEQTEEYEEHLTNTFAQLTARKLDAQKKVVRLEAKDAARYHSQEAGRLLQEIITAYCEKPKVQQRHNKRKRQKGSQDNP